MTTITTIGVLVLWLLPPVSKPKNDCPTLTGWTVSPLQTSADGGLISVAVTADDPDAWARPDQG